MTQDAAGRKPLVLVGLYHDYVLRDFQDSGVLDELKAEFDLCFAVTRELQSGLSRWGPVVGTHRMGRWRHRLWVVAFSLRHLAGLDPVIRDQKDRLRVFLRGRGRRTKALVLALHRLGLSGPLSRVLERLLAWTSPDFLDSPRRPDAALLPTGINDPFWDDLTVWCRRRGVPALTVTVNWDNIAHKLFLQRPDWLGVWGEQGYLFARLLQRFPAERILLLGTPRFEPYFQPPPPRAETRRRLGLPPEGRVLLFAGAGVVFDEVSLLEAFEAACADGRLPRSLLLLYKPHPKRHPRAGEPRLRPEAYRRVRVLPGGPALTPLGEYPGLFAAVDALVTPLSTMMLEAMLMGLPVLGLAYDDPRHGDFSWSNARLNNHLHAVLNGPWHVPCTSPERFVECLKRLLELCGDPSVGRLARDAAGFVLHRNGTPYAVRLKGALRGLAARGAPEGVQ